MSQERGRKPDANLSQLHPEYTVSTYTEDTARNVGRIAATETLDRKVAASTVARDMEEFLAGSQRELNTFFPEVHITLGSIACEATSAELSTGTYDLNCIVTPATTDI